MTGRRIAALAGALFCAAPLCAQTVKDAPLAALLDTGRYVEAERAATARIAARSDDMDAYAALTLSVLNSGDAVHREAALKLLETCTARRPQAAMCHYGIGSVLGAQVLSQGMLKALGCVGRVRDALARAVELDPLLYAARNALVQFYLVVPGIAGGSTAKAREIAMAAAPRQPEHAKLLTALVDIGQKKHEQAEAGLISVRAGDDKELAADVAEVWAQLDFTYLNDKKDARARAVFERMVLDRHNSPRGHYGLGRVFTDSGQFDQAIAAFERASALDRTAGKGSSQNLDGARKRLAQMAEAG